jgi:uncharacterized protein YktB (UPF0637 family)
MRNKKLERKALQRVLEIVNDISTNDIYIGIAEHLKENTVSSEQNFVNNILGELNKLLHTERQKLIEVNDWLNIILEEHE